MKRMNFFIIVCLLTVCPSVVASGFFNLGDYGIEPGFFFGGSYTYGSRSIVLGDNEAKVYTLKTVGYEAFIGANLADAISIYGVAGFDDFQLEESMDGEYDFKIGGGVRIKFFEAVRLALRAGETESRTFDLAVIGDFKVLYYSSLGTSVADLSEYEITWLEYQATLALSAKVDPFLFYLGGKASFLKGEFDHEFDEETKFSNDGYMSLVIGGEVDITKGIRLDAEISVFAETSISASLQFYL